jgi:hypothetical protein
MINTAAYFQRRRKHRLLAPIRVSGSVDLVSLVILHWILTAAAGEPLCGLVTHPDGTPAASAVVKATTACDDMRERLVTETTSNESGKFSLVPPDSKCRQVRLQAAKESDYWLETGAWPDILGTNGGAPILDLDAPATPLVLQLGQQGGRLSISVSDAATGVNYSARVVIRWCGGDPLSEGYEIRASMDDAYSVEFLLPAGSYCVGVSDAKVGESTEYPTKAECTLIEVRARESRELRLTVDSEKMVPQWRFADLACPRAAGSR